MARKNITPAIVRYAEKYFGGVKLELDEYGQLYQFSKTWPQGFVVAYWVSEGEYAGALVDMTGDSDRIIKIFN